MAEQREDFSIPMEEICYGSLCEIHAELLTDRKTVQSKVQNCAGSASLLRLLVVPMDELVFLREREKLDNFAVLNVETGEVLVKLSKKNGVRFEAFANASAFERTAEDAKKISRVSRSNIIKVNEITVFGPSGSSQAVEVGKLLSQPAHFLQKPSFLEASIRYENPHWLNCSNVFGVDYVPPDQTAVVKRDDSASHDDSQDVSALLDRFTCAYELEPQVADVNIKTTLMRHQREGLNFILMRESIEPICSSSLWEREDSPSGSPSFKHSILGYREACVPEEPLGGLIADEMGLGKTLTVLSAILASRKQAAHFHRNSDGNTSKTQPKSDNINLKATLIVVPSALVLDGWENEIRQHVSESALQLHKYHGVYKEICTEDLEHVDVLLTTYATVAWDFRCEGSFFRGKTWFRLVLDEAHVIRSQATKQFRAINALDAHAKWCLTGTPIQNKLEDLGALVRFLQVPLLENPDTFRDHFIKPLVFDRSTCFDNLRILLSSICLRRTKDLLNLPEPTKLNHELDFTPNEQLKYDNLKFRCKEVLQKSVGTDISAQAQDMILRLFLQLRIMCNNGTVLKNLSDDPEMLDPVDYLGHLQSIGQATCATCSCEITSLNNEHSEPGSGLLTKCNHLFCSSCLPHRGGSMKQDEERSKLATSPACSSSTSIAQKASTRPGDQKLSLGYSHLADAAADGIRGQSTKITALISDLEAHYAEAKSIVFSSWKTSLDIVTDFLRRMRIPFNFIHGALKVGERRTMLEQFCNEDGVRILLMTLGTGAVGLNLANASRIHLLEPQWNPATEAQAIGRAVRLGQSKEVVVIRYTMKKSIEETVTSRQKNKMRLAEGGFGKLKSQEEVRAELHDILEQT